MEGRIETVLGEPAAGGRGGLASILICIGNTNMMELHDISDFCEKCPICKSIPIRPAAKARHWERKSGINSLSIDRGC